MPTRSRSGSRAAGANGSKLRAGKGINLPDAVLDIDLLGSHSQEATAVRRAGRRHRRAVVRQPRARGEAESTITSTSTADPRSE